VKPRPVVADFQNGNSIQPVSRPSTLHDAIALQPLNKKDCASISNLTHAVPRTLPESQV